MSFANKNRPRGLTASIAALGAGSYLLWSGAAMAAPTTPEGIWYTKDDESIIKVKPCADANSLLCDLSVVAEGGSGNRPENSE